MKRVAIVGLPGAGKSTFARKLAAKTGLPLIHLDFYYHDKAQNYYEDKDAWVAKTNDMAAKDRWIIDGNFGKTMAARFQRADAVIYFDIPTRVALWGVIKRRLTSRSTKRADMPEDWKENANWDLLRKVWSFRKAYRPGTLELLDQNKDKEIIIFRTRGQADTYLRTLK